MQLKGGKGLCHFILPNHSQSRDHGGVILCGLFIHAQLYSFLIHLRTICLDDGATQGGMGPTYQQ